MDLFDQIRKISFAFFIVIGLAHFMAGLLYVNGYFAPMSGLVNRVLFIPFVITTLAYVLSNFKYHLLHYGKDSKTFDYTFIAVTIIVFLALLTIELLVVDSPTPLKPLTTPSLSEAKQLMFRHSGTTIL